MDIYRATGLRLREAREAAGLRSSEIAEKVGISTTKYANIERGKLHNLTLGRLDATAKATNSDVWSLAFTGLDHNHLYNARCAELISLFMQLDCLSQDELLRFVSANVDATEYYHKFSLPRTSLTPVNS